jgi:hypothetical protein
MRQLTLALGAALALSPLAAVAATTAAPAAGGVSDDARCLMTMAAFTSAKDPNTASSAQFGVAYFAGRIKARDPSFNFGQRLKAVAASMNGQNLQAEADRCGTLVVEALRELQVAQGSFAPPAGQAGAASPARPAAPAQPPKP